MTNTLTPVTFRDLAWFRREVQNKRDQRASMLESAARLDSEITALVAELRKLADELDPPTEDVAVAWDGGAREPRITIAEPVLTEADRKALQQAAQGVGYAEGGVLSRPVAKHAAPESVEYDTALVDGRLTLRPTGRTWPAACEMCGANAGQPCQAVTE